MMHKPSSFRDYVISLLIASALSVLFSCYLIIRRGYFFDAPPTADMLYVPNKMIVGVGTVLLAFTFLVGPIVRYFDRFDKWLGYRKEIGIVGAFFIFFHAIISYYFLPLKFAQSFFTLDSPEFAAGLIGVFLLIFLYIISFNKAIDILGSNRWWFLQRWGLRLVILFTLIHVYVMKWNGWVKWIKVGGSVNPTAELAHPQMTGLGLLVMLFVTWVVIVRLYESLLVFKSCGFEAREVCTDITLRTRGRKFFIGSFWALVLLYILILTRWMW